MSVYINQFRITFKLFIRFFWPKVVQCTMKFATLLVACSFFFFNIFEYILFFFVYLFICGAEMDNKIHYHNLLRRKWVLCLNAYFLFCQFLCFYFTNSLNHTHFFVLNLKCMEINSFNIYHGSFVHISIEYAFFFFLYYYYFGRERHIEWKTWYVKILKIKTRKKNDPKQKTAKIQKELFYHVSVAMRRFFFVVVVLLFELFVCYLYFFLPFRSMHSITCKLIQLVAYWMFIFAYETYL